ncbi:MAG: major capsid protein [Hydrogenophaga sp.]|nr:major capsid protein [Hydrogenophaga sp.]
MASLDIFNDNAFGVTSMITAINEAPHVPTMLGDMRLFTEEGMSTTSAFIEMEGETLSLVPAAERGAPGKTDDKRKRKVIPFKVVHLPQMGGINADEVQGVRAYGSETEVQTVQGIVNRELAVKRQNLDVTLEFQRMGAVKGIVYDADGATELLDLYEAFGVTQQTLDVQLDVADTKVRNKMIAAKRMIEAYLGGITSSGYLILASAAFHDAFVSHPDVEKAYDRWQEGGFLRSDTRKGFEFAETTIREYRGKVGSQDFIADGEAYMIPLGVPRMFMTKFAPADYMETVNTMGLPYYAKQELRKFNKGVDIETQSNPLMINTRPRAVIRLTV